jgi:hypothetical protein
MATLFVDLKISPDGRYASAAHTEGTVCLSAL